MQNCTLALIYSSSQVRNLFQSLQREVTGTLGLQLDSLLAKSWLAGHEGTKAKVVEAAGEPEAGEELTGVLANEHRGPGAQRAAPLYGPGRRGLPRV
jgi:hypothetical protein